MTDDGNYEADFKELNMCFAPITGNISVSKYSSTIGFMDDIAEGVYDVTVTAPTASGNVERSFKPVSYTHLMQAVSRQITALMKNSLK